MDELVELVDKIITLFDLKNDDDTRKYIYRALEQTCTNHFINVEILKKEFEHLGSSSILKEIENLCYDSKNILVKDIIVVFGVIADYGIRDLPAVNKLPEILNRLKKEGE